MTSNFQKIASALADFVSTPRSLVDATNSVMQVLNLPDALTEHDERVLWVLKDKECLALLQDGRRISAIKRVRAEFDCGLKEAYDAIEDTRVPSASSY